MNEKLFYGNFTDEDIPWITELIDKKELKFPDDDVWWQHSYINIIKYFKWIPLD